MENKKEEEQNKENTKENSLEIPYTIKTMDSDLKKENSKMSSFKINEEKEIKEEVDTKENIKKIQEKDPFHSKSQKNPDPFLENLTPNVDKPVKQVESELKPISQKPSLKSDENQTNQIPLESIKKKSEPNLEKSKEKNNSNTFLFFLLIIISLITTGSGFYYFFYAKKDTLKQETPLKEENPPIINKEKDFLINNKSIESSTIVLNEEEELLKKLKSQKNEIDQSSNFEIMENNQTIEAENLLSKLNITLPKDFLSEINKVWINLNKENEVLKLGLIFEINNIQKVEAILLETEPLLPEILSSLFVDETFVLQEENISFRDSDELKGVKYYNLVKGFNDKAIDWKIQDEKYLLITTSQETMADLVFSLENNQIEINEEKVNEVENQEMLENEMEIEAN